MVPVWRLDDNFWELVPSAVVSRDQTQLARLAWRVLLQAEVSVSFVCF